MHPIDRQILDFCRDGFHPLKLLIGPIASGTAYRHARRLGALGWRFIQESEFAKGVR